MHAVPCLLKVIYFAMSDIALLEKNINLTTFLAESLQNIIAQNMLGGRKLCQFCMYIIFIVLYPIFMFVFNKGFDLAWVG